MCFYSKCFTYEVLSRFIEFGLYSIDRERDYPKSDVRYNNKKSRQDVYRDWRYC